MLAGLLGPTYPLLKIVAYYWPVFPLAFLVALLTTPISRRVAFRLGVVDYPDQKVKTHARPTAYLGGVGILMGLLAGLLTGFFILLIHQEETLAAMPHRIAREHPADVPNWVMLAGIGFGAVIATIVGVLDDVIDLRPWQKLLGQMLAAAVLLAVGVYPNLSYLTEFVGIELSFGWNLALSIPIVLFFILGATNSLNLLDGLDGLCAGVTSIITLAFLFLAVGLTTWGFNPLSDPVRLVVCLALVGGTLGFLPQNRHPARIFMGDAGSILLGYVSGAVMLLFCRQPACWSVGAVIIFGLPILDTAVALVRRFRNHRPLLVSDRGHIYDQLIDRGWSLRRTVLTCYLIAAIYAVTGIAVSYLRFRYSLVAFAAVTLISAVIVARGGFLQEKRGQEPFS
jgi:UDP-GlcNAc:undecaprenyl-phosphate GlcNAc-1-phosphate transferase